jgi:hypothetical protein
VQQLATGNWQLAKQKQPQKQKPKNLTADHADLRGYSGVVFLVTFA